MKYILAVILIAVAITAQARTVHLTWDQNPDADSYALYRCDMINGEWSDLYALVVIDVIDLTDPTLPGYTDTTADDLLSHCYQIYAVLNGTYSRVGSNFATNILPGDIPSPNFPAPATGLQAN